MEENIRKTKLFEQDYFLTEKYYKDAQDIGERVECKEESTFCGHKEERRNLD